MGDNTEFRAYFSEDETEVFVLTGPLPKLGLKQEPEPQDAPAYINLETGEGYYPEEVSPQQASDAINYVRNKVSGDISIHLKKNTEAWRREFSDLFGMDKTVSFWSVDMDERDPGNNRF